MKFAAFVAALFEVCGACKSPAPAKTAATSPAPSAPNAPAAAGDPIVAKVDLSEIRAARVRDRLALPPPPRQAGDTADQKTPTAEEKIAQAIVWAATDVLVVREMAVLKEFPRPSETDLQASERFLAGVWRADAGCDAGAQEVQLAYLRDIGKYKHPASFTLWDAQFQCCVDVDHCPAADLSACRAAMLPAATRLKEKLSQALAQIPVALPLDATCELDQSPFKARQVPAFEGVVAELATAQPKLELRRYTAFDAQDTAFQNAHFRQTDPALARAAQQAKLGELLGPIETIWGVDVALVVARDHARYGKSDPAVVADVRAKICREMAQQQRDAYRERLLKGALIYWQKPTIEQIFGKGVVQLLPPDATARLRPNLPPGL